MKFAKGKSAAITAGLCAALTISQTIAPVSQAFALSNAEVSAKTNTCRCLCCSGWPICRRG